MYKQDVTISDMMVIKKDSKSKILYLTDIIYFGAFHFFTSCIISSNQMVWYHNSMLTGSTTVQGGFLNEIENLNICNERHASAAIYSQK